MVLNLMGDMGVQNRPQRPQGLLGKGRGVCVCVWGGGGGGAGLYTYCYTVTTRLIHALKLAAMRAVVMFHYCEGQSHKTVSTDHSF